MYASVATEANRAIDRNPPVLLKDVIPLCFGIEPPAFCDIKTVSTLEFNDDCIKSGFLSSKFQHEIIDVDELEADKRDSSEHLFKKCAQGNKNVGFSKTLIERFHEAGLMTVQDVVLTSVLDFPSLRRVGLGLLSDERLTELITRLGGTLIPPPASLLDCSGQDVSTGCFKLDRWLGGGIRRGALLEVSGEAGSGKTCLALQSVAHCLLHTSHRVIYFAVETFTHERLIDIIRCRAKETLEYAVCNEKEFEWLPKLLSRLLINRVTDSDTLLMALESVPKIAYAQPGSACLLIIDSIAGLWDNADSRSTKRARVCDGESLTSRNFEAETPKNQISSLKAAQIGRVLRRIAIEANVGVLLTNQVRANETYDVLPALGIAWANLIHTRVIIHRVSVASTRTMNRSQECTSDLKSAMHSIEDVKTDRNHRDMEYIKHWLQPNRCLQVVFSHWLPAEHRLWGYLGERGIVGL